MATRRTENKKQPPAKVSSEALARQTEDFLKAGGKIEVVKSGVSGQQMTTGRRQITLGNSPRSAEKS